MVAAEQDRRQVPSAIPTRARPQKHHHLTHTVLSHRPTSEPLTYTEHMPAQDEKEPRLWPLTGGGLGATSLRSLAFQSAPLLRPRPAGHGSSDGYREVANGSGSFLRFETVTPSAGGRSRALASRPERMRCSDACSPKKQQRDNGRHAGAWAVRRGSDPAGGLKSCPGPLSALCGCGGRCYSASQMSLQNSLLSLLLLPPRGE